MIAQRSLVSDARLCAVPQINSIKSNEIKKGEMVPKTVHQVSGAMADAIITQAAIEKSLDNLTIVIVTFDNL